MEVYSFFYSLDVYPPGLYCSMYSTLKLAFIAIESSWIIASADLPSIVQFG